jgi:hypothetical protein
VFLMLARQRPVLTQIRRIQWLFVVVGRIIMCPAQVVADEVSQLLCKTTIERESKPLIGGTRRLLKVILWRQGQSRVPGPGEMDAAYIAVFRRDRRIAVKFSLNARRQLAAVGTQIRL